MSYNIDLNLLSLNEYKELLKQQNLLPGRRMLLDDIDERFLLLGNQGITNVFELRKSLSTSKKTEMLAEKTGISNEYLAVLRREFGSLEQKPVLLESFPDIDNTQLESLKNNGIKTSQDYYEMMHNSSDELFCLCDLVRINGVGPIAAKAFYEAGYKSVLDVADVDAEIMLKNISAINSSKKYYKAKLGIKDMQFCIDFAALLVKYTKKL